MMIMWFVIVLLQYESPFPKKAFLMFPFHAGCTKALYTVMSADFSAVF